ncbi:MAG: hypothetical protein ACI8S3_002604, partial [Alphaproteobacteria bacterium]
ARPIPEAPPVISAILSATRSIIISVFDIWA